MILLPAPAIHDQLSQAIHDRRTAREYAEGPIIIEQLAQLLWAARTVPSAGALYLLDYYLITADAVYQYQTTEHGLTQKAEGDYRARLAAVCLHQQWMAQAPIMLLIAVDHNRYKERYGNRGLRYAYIEAGCAAQNVFLQAEALGLGVGIVGAFKDKKLANLVNLPPNVEPVLVMPVGRKADG